MRPPFRAFALVVTLGAAACGDKPAPQEAFEGEPLRTQTLPNDLVLEIMREGEGAEAARGDRATIVYRVRTAEGQVVGSGEPRELTFSIGRDKHLVEGLQLGVEGMRLKELRNIVVPPRLGYRGRANTGFPPDADLVFSVELTQLAPSP